MIILKSLLFSLWFDEVFLGDSILCVGNILPSILCWTVHNANRPYVLQFLGDDMDGTLTKYF